MRSAIVVLPILMSHVRGLRRHGAVGGCVRRGAQLPCTRTCGCHVARQLLDRILSLFHEYVEASGTHLWELLRGKNPGTEHAERVLQVAKNWWACTGAMHCTGNGCELKVCVRFRSAMLTGR